ncbi:hypothetical protein GQ457_06G043470 [Hibiscus cannabinus]
MAAASNSLLPFTHTSLSQPGRLSQSQSQPLPFPSLSFPRSPSLSPKLTHRSNSALHCSLNVPSSTDKDTPIETRYPAFPTVMDINQIREILPHRFPFLLVDRVIEYNPGVSAVAIKNVTINDNFFPGHFPERPIMPGVLMVEAMAQVGGIVMLQPEVGGSRENFFFAGVDKVRFRKPVIAGDTLVMRMTLIKLQKRFGIAKMEGKAYVGGDLVCEENERKRGSKAKYHQNRRMLPGKRSSNPLKRTTSMRGLPSDFSEADVQLQRPTPSDVSPPPEFPDSQTSPFLRSCCLCNRRLAPARDIFMYRGDTAFCSERCRALQMKQDERRRRLNLAAAAAKSDKEDLRSSSTSVPVPDPSSTTESLVAA